MFCEGCQARQKEHRHCLTCPVVLVIQEIPRNAINKRKMLLVTEGCHEYLPALMSRSTARIKQTNANKYEQVQTKTKRCQNNCGFRKGRTDNSMFYWMFVVCSVGHWIWSHQALENLLFYSLLLICFWHRMPFSSLVLFGYVCVRVHDTRAR